ncbi:hypothetical protein CRYUN_Cryun26dG0071000 [Craigia yunnanensis]
MKLYTSNIYVFNFVLLLSFFRSSEANYVASISSLLPVNACATVNCGQGTCRETDNSSFGFECDCNSGWNKYQIGSMVLPPTSSPTLVTLLGAVMGAVKQMGQTTNAIAMQALIIGSISQPYPASTNVIFFSRL